MSKRQSIITAIENRMKTILTANGYATNAGQRVYTWRTTPLADNELPALLVYDAACTNNADGGIIGQHEHTLEVVIEALAAGSTCRSVVRSMMADIFKAIGTDDNWSGLADMTIMQSHEINLEQAEKTIGAGIVRFSVTYRTPQWEI